MTNNQKNPVSNIDTQNLNGEDYMTNFKEIMQDEDTTEEDLMEYAEVADAEMALAIMFSPAATLRVLNKLLVDFSELIEDNEFCKGAAKLSGITFETTLASSVICNAFFELDYEVIAFLEERSIEEEQVTYMDIEKYTEWAAEELSELDIFPAAFIFDSYEATTY